MVHGEEGGELSVGHQPVGQGEGSGLATQEVIIVHAGLVA